MTNRKVMSFGLLALVFWSKSVKENVAPNRRRRRQEYEVSRNLASTLRRESVTNAEGKWSSAGAGDQGHTNSGSPATKLSNPGTDAD